MGKKTKPKYPDCCPAMGKLDRTIGGVIVSIATQREDGTQIWDIKQSTLREEWNFNFCPYCGRKIWKKKGTK